MQLTKMQLRYGFKDCQTYQVTWSWSGLRKNFVAQGQGQSGEPGQGIELLPEEFSEKTNVRQPHCDRYVRMDMRSRLRDLQLSYWADGPTDSNTVFGCKVLF